MTTTRSVEERITRWFVQDAPGELPDRILEAAFARTRVLPQERGYVRSPLGRRWTVLIAAALIVGSLVGAAIAGGLVVRLTTSVPRPDTLQEILDSDVVRVAIRPDHPQTQASGTIDGFDVDVARELARRLGSTLQLIELTPDAMLAGSARWDVALPSTPAWSIDEGAYLLTSPYYRWPHVLLVRADSGVISVDDVRGQPICAVEGSPGQSWLLGRYGGPSASSGPGSFLPSTLVLTASDDECLSRLEEGSVLSMVTASMSPADVSALVWTRPVGGPPPEPRSMLVHRRVPGGPALTAAIETALADMRADGTLARLSTNRFGADLSIP
jgi:ABC-type amino acid transport substrate-binding protein